ncbi:DUF1428 domain-containing protein [Aeromonas caviae]|uniref:DUF1428 domain-containing protein n=1 Tax=Aeromonas caviae TaxID=648 RepID=UPI002280F795|nr:DUF1428 domain-containing protein [Aeromonas caviae]MCY9813927.1 DUF1428 domain-containing protein [Aeromonas caviae]
MSYVDGFVIAVPTVNKQALIDHAGLFDPIFLEYGATWVLECWGDDVPHGKQTDFYRAVAAKEDETVVFSWVEWPSKAVRDDAMGKMMQDPRMDPVNPLHQTMPFDGARMIFGGFTTVLELKG